MNNLIEAKFKLPQKKGELPRSRISSKLESLLQQRQILLLHGITGSGKTAAVRNYLLGKEGKLEYCYWKLDMHDNHLENFQMYFKKAAQILGLRIESTELEDLLREALELLNRKTEESILVLDGIQHLKSPSIIKELCLFLEYIPKTFKVLLLNDGRLSDVFLQMYLNGHIELFPMNELLMLNYEIEEMLHLRTDLTGAQIQELLRQTGGIPGALAMQMRYFEEHKVNDEEYDFSGNALLKLYMEENVWTVFEEDEKNLLAYACWFPYITEEFCCDVLETPAKASTLVQLERAGLLTYDASNGFYQLPEFLGKFIKGKWQKDGKAAAHVKLIKAIDWYDSKGNEIETIKVVNELHDPKILSRYLEDHAKTLAHVLKAEELKNYLRDVEGTDEKPLLLYLIGVLCLRQEEYRNYQAALERLHQMYIDNVDCKRDVGEILVNLMYEDPNVSIQEWLKKAESFAEEIGAFRLYSLTAGVPSIRCGMKDLTLLFMEGSKREKEYRKRWSEVLADAQSEYFDLAMIEYLLETDREQQALQSLETMFSAGRDSREFDWNLGMGGILYRIQKSEKAEKEMADFLNTVTREVRRSHNQTAIQNNIALRVFTESLCGKRDHLIQWIRQMDLQREKKITGENAYVQLIRAKGLLSLHQFERAERLFSRLNAFYQRNNKTFYQADAAFGEAAALYQRGERVKSLKKATEAMVLGAPFRYIGVYTQYGETGVKMIKEYQQMIWLDTHTKQEKKKYYYGNVLKASFEGYQSVLLRCAQKELRRSSGSPDGNTETLTMTEIAILQYINIGCSNQEIALKMNIKVTTVKTHIYSIYRKLGVNGRVMAINKGKEIGII